jgi:hypothetical protein
LVSKTLGDEMRKTFWLTLQKLLTLSNRDKYTPECLTKLCENLEKQHINLLLHAEIRWLSRRRDLHKVSELKGESQDYFQENSRPEKMKNGWRY